MPNTLHERDQVLTADDRRPGCGRMNEDLNRVCERTMAANVEYGPFQRGKCFIGRAATPKKYGTVRVRKLSQCACAGYVVCHHAIPQFLISLHEMRPVAEWAHLMTRAASSHATQRVQARTDRVHFSLFN